MSAVTALEYESDADSLGSPLNLTKTTQFAFKNVTGGSSITPGQAPPDAAVTLADPIPGATPVRMTVVTYMTSDPSYTQTVKDLYAVNNIRTLVTSTQTKNGTGSVISAKSEIKYDEPNYGNSYRGQPTTVRSWLDTNNSWIETHAKYDTYGNAIESTDAKGNTTTTTFDGTYHTFPVQVTSPVPSDGIYGSNTPFVSTTTYNLTTGQPQTTTDPNGLETRIEYNDPLLRPTRVAAYQNNFQVGAASETSYGAGTSVSSTRWLKTRSQIDETRWKEGYTWYDGLGRTIKSQSVDSDGDVFVETEYDNMSRPKRATNPYRANETVYWTENTFDTAGRQWKITTADGAVVETTYGLATTGSQIGTVVTVKDQAGKLRRSVTNALGHLTRVDEPNNAGQLGTIDAPNQPTSYTYDLLNNLLQVQQTGDNNEECGASTATCSQTRTFQYDSLSRLKQATNPESGTINYGYDPNGNLTTKADARGIVTTYAYDSLNRVKTRQYTNVPTGSETPNVSYFYDLVTKAKGKLIKVSSSLSTTEYVSFDILGRVTRSRQTTDGVVYGDDTIPMTYTYNLSGALIEQQYPSGRKVQNTIDSNGDLEMVRSRKNTTSGYWAYANNFSYNSAGAMNSMQLGNGRWESMTFNSRLQPTEIKLGTVQNGSDKLNLAYTYGTTANNGNVLSQTITVATVGTTAGFAAVQTYNYDSLNRLKDATEDITPTGGSSSQSWKQVFSFDRYGNRNFVTGSGQTTTLGSCATAVCNPSIDVSNNRLSSSIYTYDFDVAGNTTRDALDRKFTYDGENKQVKVESLSPNTNTVTGTVGEYYYDGDGKRVKKYVPSTGETTIFVYDAGGKLVAEYSSVVASTNDAKVAYLTNDHLGSPRINTDSNGTVTARHDYHPFGEEIATSQRRADLGYAEDTVRNQFTGYQRDGETGLDFAQARTYISQLGRFTVPDPLLGSMSPRAPQTYNRYAYVGNNPLKLVDPSGLTWYRRIDEDGTEHYKWFGDKDEVGAGYQVYMGSLEYNSGSDHVYLNPLGPNRNGANDYERNGWIINNTPAMSGVGTGINDPGGREVGMEIFLNVYMLFTGIRGVGAVIEEADAAAAAAVNSGTARAAATEAAELMLANGQNPRAVSAAVDITTGETSIGVSGGADPPVLHSIMRERIDLLNSTGGSRTPWCISNCAEFRSVNEALLKGSELNNLEVHTVKTTNGLPAFQRCPNCQVTTKGARVTSDP